MHPFYKNIYAFCDYVIMLNKLHKCIILSLINSVNTEAFIIKTRFLKLIALIKGERRERQKNNFNKNFIKSLMPCYSPAITTHLMRC